VVTQRGAALLVGAVLLWLVGRSLGVPELYVAALAAAALVGAAALAVRVGVSSIAVRRQVQPPRVLYGGSGTVRLELRNDARWDTTALLLVEDACHAALADRPARFSVAGLRPHRATELRYPVVGGRRGRFTIGPVRIRVRDPFGLVERTHHYTETSALVVYPRIERLSDRLAQGSHRGSEASDVRRLINAGDEFYTMREYATGDDLRLVHWPSTARRQRLMVRQHELPWQAQATVLCDTRSAAHRGVGPDSTVERSISVAASLVWHLADAGYQLRLVTETDTAPGPVTPWHTALDRLATIEQTSLAHLGPALLRLRTSGAEGLLAAVVTSGLEQADLRSLLHAGRSFSGRVALVVDLEQPAGAADEVAALLTASGWRAACVRRGAPLADAWGRITTARRRVPAGGRR
jgi:uncharacterized protein (DUF58 family)